MAEQVQTAAEVTLCVLVMGKPGITSECLYSLLNTEYPSYDIAIVNNGHPDMAPLLLEFQRAAARQRRDCTLIMNSRNVGAASGRNQVLRLSTNPYVAFVDNDSIVCDPHWLATLVACMESDPVLAAAGPKLLFRNRPTVIQAAGGGVSRSGCVCDMGRNLPKDSPEYSTGRDVQFLSSACMLLRSSAASKCGPFDSVFDPVLFEEIDLCYRMRSLGYRLRYVPDAEILHYENTTTFGSSEINGRYLFAKHARLFKNRWRHVYENEDGPTEDQVRAFNSRSELGCGGA